MIDDTACRAAPSSLLYSSPIRLTHLAYWQRWDRWRSPIKMGALSAGDRRDVPPDGHLERRLGIVRDVAAPPRAIDAIERQRFDRSPDPAHRRRIERNVVRKAVHEAQGTAIHRHHRDIAGEQRAPAFRARAPVQDRAAGKMPAGPHQKDIVRYPVTIAGPWHDGGMRPRDEGAIVTMQIDGYAAERFAPVGDRAIVMRMRDGDRLQATERADVVDGFAGGQRHAIPHHAAIGLGHQQRALPDRETRLHADAGNVEVVTPDELVTFRQLPAREPGLPLPVHILPLVFADRAGLRRLGAFGKLGAALFTGPQRHRHYSCREEW